MKKFAFVLVAACAVLVSCSKDESGSDSGKSTPVVGFTYAQNEVVRKCMSMILTVDGKEYKFDKESDTQTVTLTKESGTISMACKVDETVIYSENQDVVLSVNVAAGSMYPGSQKVSSLTTVAQDDITMKGVSPQTLTKVLTTHASILTKSVTYTVDSEGKVSVK